MKRFTIVLILTLLSGCQTFTLEAPEDFLELEVRPYSSYVMRATSADGVVLATREIDNEREGTLPFWTAALQDRLRYDLGYALTEEKSVQAASGETGKQLRFGRDENGEPYDYWVTVFVTDPALGPSQLYLIECGGKREAFTPREVELNRAIAGFELH